MNAFNDETIVVSFSGGKTSGLMARYLQLRYPEKKKVFVFVNTGMEREETLQFADECDRRWDLGLIWLQAHITFKVNTTKQIDFKSANRSGLPFARMIIKYGLPNKSFPHCTRELKERPIRRYIRDVLNVENYSMAIGIRYDEQHRISDSKRDAGFIYPLADELRMTKDIVNQWWDKQDFNLHLKDYEGNCDFCWKKSRRKRLTLLAEGLDVTRWQTWEKKSDYKFDRDGYSILQLKDMAKNNFHKVRDVHETKRLNPVLFDNMDFEMECFCKSS